MLLSFVLIPKNLFMYFALCVSDQVGELRLGQSRSDIDSSFQENCLSMHVESAIIRFLVADIDKGDSSKLFSVGIRGSVVDESKRRDDNSLGL